MVIWDQVVEVLRESIFAYAQVCNGNLGAGILIVTFLARLALLPVGVRVARAAAHQQEAMARLQARVDALRGRHRNDPKRLAEEIRRLYAREGLSPFSGAGCIGAMAQLPVVAAMYSAVSQAASIGGRFLWIRDLARPDWILALIGTAFTCLAAATGVTSSQNRSLLLSVSAVITLIALSKMAAGVGLYWGLSSLFGAAQGWAVQRLQRRAA